MRFLRKSRLLKRFFKRITPKTLFARSLLILVTPIILIQMVSTFMFFDRHWGRMTSRLAYAVAGEITWIADEIEQNPLPENVARISNNVTENLNLLLAYKPDEKLDMQTVSKRRIGWESMIGAALQQELEGRIERPYTVDVDFQGKWIEIRVQLKGGILSVSLPQRRLFSSSSYIFLIWVFSISFVLLVIAILFMRNQIRPIRRLAIAAERFGKGRDVSDFKLEGAKEVRQAGQAFLDMRTRIQRQITQRTEMLAGVSHDLRTPLTRLKLQIAMFGDHPDAQAMKGDIQDMERMIEGYLDFVRGEGKEKTEITDVVGMLRDIVFSSKRQGFHAELDAGIIENVYMPLRPSAFKRCLENIITNAGKYGDCVWLTLLRVDEGTIEIIIEDNGPGIPEDQYEDVFRPFYRVDSSRNMQTGGVGLGLPIAMDIVHAHGGKIRLGKSKHGGLAVYIRLPL